MPYKDRDKYLSTQKSYYHKDKASYKWRNIKNTYGISKEEFFDMFDDQDGKCALCRKVFPGLSNNELHIDHNHETNKVRGLLCMQCNVGLGMMGDNEAGLLRALDYIRNAD